MLLPSAPMELAGFKTAREAHPQELEFITDDSMAGFRLKRLEVFNWGTFHGKVYTLVLDGKNVLLTGDAGSGKTTLVDAITTLLVPPARLAYNRAGGAEAKERHLRSYVLGYYKTEESSTSPQGRPVGLRGPNQYSVILATFMNAGNGEVVTLAQVFWMKDTVQSPERFYVVAPIDLNIAEHFSDFGSDPIKLKKRLRSQGAEIENTFPPYAAWFRRRVGFNGANGNNGEQAMDLFNQTVSMKTIGSLTDFVRTHMLEPFDVQQRIDDLVAHFDNLNRAHESVLKAKRQIELLEPIVVDLTGCEELDKDLTVLRASRAMLDPYFAGIKHGLLTKRIEQLQHDWDTVIARIDRLNEDKQRLEDSERSTAPHFPGPPGGGNRWQGSLSV